VLLLLLLLVSRSRPPQIHHPQSVENVHVHPLVLLSVVDHYNRVAKDTRKRAVGIILGERRKGGVLEVTNSFALPFEEDEKNPEIFFLDHSYLENMYRMFRKVNAREKVIGWYHTGPRLRENDMSIHRLVSEYVDGLASKAQAVLVICEVKVWCRCVAVCWWMVASTHESESSHARVRILSRTRSRTHALTHSHHTRVAERCGPAGACVSCGGAGVGRERLQ
jgi:proteasome lid subunit RPN8/RPN11